jgi:hypothetical protein
LDSECYELSNKNVELYGFYSDF